jgi:hypothetical protein
MIDVKIVDLISEEAKYTKIKTKNCKFVSYVKSWSKGRIRINIYYEIDMLILCITGKIKHPTYRKFDKVKYSLIDKIFKYPNRFK